MLGPEDILAAGSWQAKDSQPGDRAGGHPGRWQVPVVGCVQLWAASWWMPPSAVGIEKN